MCVCVRAFRSVLTEMTFEALTTFSAAWSTFRADVYAPTSDADFSETLSQTLNVDDLSAFLATDRRAGSFATAATRLLSTSSIKKGPIYRKILGKILSLA